MKELILKLAIALIDVLLLGVGCMLIGIYTKSNEFGWGIFFIGLAFMGKK